MSHLRIKPNSSATILFMEEPRIIYQHWDEVTNKSVPCADDDCALCDAGVYQQRRYEADVQNVDEAWIQYTYSFPSILYKEMKHQIYTVTGLGVFAGNAFRVYRTGAGRDTRWECSIISAAEEQSW